MTTMMRSELLHVRLRGQYACFTRPEYRTERVSAIAPSHAAWEGTLSQIMGHRGCRYEIERAGFLFLPRILTATQNEVSDFGSGRKPVDILKHRTLRTTALLAGKKRLVPDFKGDMEEDAGVDYVVSFRLLYPEEKYLAMLLSRLRSGRYYGTHPYLGMREFVAKFEPVFDLGSIGYPRALEGRPDLPLIQHKDGLRTVDFSESLGISFFGTDWDDSRHPNYFAPLDVRRGVLEYPSWREVRKLGIRKESAA